MITLHHLNNSRSQRILWLLEELNLDYEIQQYQRDAKTNLAPQTLLDVHPLGKSPIITDGDLVMAESGAIIEYLLAQYGKHLIPETNTPDYWQYVYWLHFSEGTLMPPLVTSMLLKKIGSNPAASEPCEQVSNGFVNPNIMKAVQYIEDHLTKNEWFAGAELSGADIQMSFPLEAAQASGIINENHPHISAYLTRVHARTAYQKGLEKGGEYAFA